MTTMPDRCRIARCPTGNCSGRRRREAASSEQLFYAALGGGIEGDQIEAVELAVEDAADHGEDVGVGLVEVAGAGGRRGAAFVAVAQGAAAEGSQGLPRKARR